MIAVVAVLSLDEFRYAVEELTDETQTRAVGTASAIERELTWIDRMARTLSTNAAL